MKTQGQKILFLISFFAFIIGYSQIKVSGKVTFKNKGIPEVNVTLKDTYDGATTDAQGNFSFETSEKGSRILTFIHPKYEEVEKSINVDNQEVVISVSLKEQISEIDAIVVSAGSIEASDKKRATALLSPIDIYTTAGADGQISSALTYLPGVQKVGDKEGLFIRGGTGTESKIFMDGSLINNYFSNSIPGIAGRDQFNTSLFKGNIFSSGGYSALYGQALSGALLLESVDLPDQSSYDVAISPIFLSGGFQRLSNDKTHSFGATLGYSMLNLMQKALNFNTNFIDAPQGLNSDFNFRIKTKSGGFLKYYGMYNSNKMGVKTESLEPGYDFALVRLNGENTYHNLSFRQKFGKYLLNVGGSYSYNRSDLNFSTETNDAESGKTRLLTDGNYINFKAVLERKINKISAIRGGFELNNTDEKLNFGDVNKQYNDLISSAFVETDLGFSNALSAKIGVRAENSSFLNKSNIAPRLALAYRFAKDWTSSFAYGLFYQNPESKYINGPANLDFQKSQHYIFQVQRASEGRTLRFEAFYKKYDQLIKTFNINPGKEQNQQIQTALNNDGYGYAKGLELFWRDNKKTFKNIDYWITYSFLDSKRDFLNYPVSLKPSFAAEHTLSAVVKRFIPEWKLGVNMSYTYTKGRPYYDIATQFDEGKSINYVRNEGRLKDYNALNFSFNYLPNLGKKDAKAFMVLVLSVTNVLGSKNVYGYNFSVDGSRSSAVVPPVNTFVFVGAFISFGTDKTEDAINNNL
ncbi:TonB-dependent receptor [Chryseobacterium lactis]|uniref:TonB-dependent receptor n=1 Tax=Chryseobacterium lactis TaxID=1241981 RepID=A0A3G6RTS0_CHRLC|nr:TonB-dependent receptor [Chryseobacterium lactis]AZA81398.1 TonB-dependent receptor [Chryseobacterium lactis]AZB06397.1 TonB-dependent receptor [Chryseobacterium lactis]PNW15249.1 TonB-dependent receptor [Chryseobacterium lactis]